MFPLGDTIPSRDPPVMTWLLILANSLVFLVELSMAEYSLKHFFYLFGIVPARYTNMWTLWIFGDNVEDCIGPIRFLFFYPLCGLAAGVVHCLANPQSTVPSVGASGAIAGVLGAYFVLLPYARVIVLVPILFFPLFFELPALTYLGFWALIQVFSGTLSLAGPSDVGGVAWWAHVGGFAAGILLQFFFVRRRNAYRWPSCDEYEMESAWLPVRYWENDR